jgi:hypothetical protein
MHARLHTDCAINTRVAVSMIRSANEHIPRKLSVHCVVAALTQCLLLHGCLLLQLEYPPGIIECSVRTYKEV